MTASSDRVPDIMLERYRLQELPAPAMARIEQRLREDEGLRRRLAALDEADAELTASGRLALLEERVRRGRLSAGDPSPGRVWTAIPRWAVLTAVATAMVAVAVAPRLTSFGSEETERIKGLQPSLTLYRRVGNSSEALADGAVARAGDLIRVGYRAAGRAYGVILSVDGRGQVTLHLPPVGDQAAPLGNEGTVLLDRAFELDDAPRFERFYFVTSNQPFAIAPIAAAARGAGGSSGAEAVPPLALGAGLEQEVTSLLKESRP